MSKNQVHQAWETLMNTLPIQRDVEEKGYYIIDAPTVKRLTKVEPRHVCNIYTYDKLPDVLKRNGLDFVSINNKEWCIGKFNTYALLPEGSSILQPVYFDPEIKSIQLQKMKTEGVALGYTKGTSIFDFIKPNRERLLKDYVLQTSMSSFSFDIGTYHCNAKDPQVQVDGVFEFERSICVVEAKVTPGTRISSFQIRQLYYPYRYFYDQKIGKEIIPIFMVFDNKKQVYDFYKFRFRDPMRFDSIELAAYKSFVLKESSSLRSAI